MSVEKTLRQAAKLAARGDRAGAARLYREVLAAFPANANAKKGLAALSAQAAPGGRGGARPVSGPVSGPGPAAPRPAAAPAPPPAELARLTRALQQGQARRVATEGQRLALLFPTAPALLNLMAMALAQLGRLEESLAWSDRVIAADPQFAGAHLNKAAALARLGRHGETEAEARAALALDPRLAQAHMLLGHALVNTDRAAAAEAPLRKAIQLAPRALPAHLGLGNAMAAMGRHHDALTCFQAALAIDPANSDALNNLGNALSALGRADEAAARHRAAVQEHPQSAVMRTNYAQALRDLGQIDAAIAQCEQAIELAPNNVDAWAQLGACRNALGDREATIVALDRAAEIDPNHVHTLALRWRVGGYSVDHPQFPQLIEMAQRANLAPADRTQVELALFGAYDRAGDYDVAFDHLARANRVRRESQPYDIERERGLFEAVKAAFAAPVAPLGAEDLAEIPAPFRPVFIVGMPRSGTSLVEQILASHSQVQGGGELPALGQAMTPLVGAAGKIGTPPSREALRSLRKSYFEAVWRQASDRPVITDKTPLNFRFLGFALAAMPEARVLALRRDSRATCWSNFSNSFAGRGNNFGNDMRDTAKMYRMHLDLIDFWRTRYPDRIAVVPYERLTEHQEEESHKLVAATGLDWEPACLDFHQTERAVRTASSMQVREKMYQGSSETWRRYQAHLGPMLELLDGLD